MIHGLSASFYNEPIFGLLLLAFQALNAVKGSEWKNIKERMAMVRQLRHHFGAVSCTFMQLHASHPRRVNLEIG